MGGVGSVTAEMLTRCGIGKVCYVASGGDNIMTCRILYTAGIVRLRQG